MAMWNIAAKVIEKSDIVLEVLDARFIEETRNLKFEEKIEKEGKQIIYVVNKIDLVKNVYLREYTRDLSLVVLVSTKKKMGTQKLRDLIKKYAKEETNVGVIGYPNTGKSSLINALVGARKARTSSQSGMTRGMQYVKLTSTIRLIDSPGTYPVDKEELVLISAKDFSKVKDPEHYVEILLEKFPGKIEKYYAVKSIEELAIERGHLKKGGVADLGRTCRVVLKDWQQGKIIL